MKNNSLSTSSTLPPEGTTPPSRLVPELSFYLTSKGVIKYHKKCASCTHPCKQSFRVLSISCPKFTRIPKTDN